VLKVAVPPTEKFTVNELEVTPVRLKVVNKIRRAVFGDR